MIEYVKEAMPNATVVGFDKSSDALSYAKEKGCDVLLSEIELYGKPSGIDLARKIQRINPRVNVIFATVCSPNEYAKEVMDIRPSSYLTKVVEKGEIERALGQLLYPIG